MKCCFLGLLGEAWFKICDRRDTIKSECELILKWIENIFLASLQQKKEIIIKTS